MAKTGCEIATYTAVFGSTEATASEIVSAKAEDQNQEPSPDPVRQLPESDQDTAEDAEDKEPAVDITQPTPVTTEGLLIAFGCTVLVAVPTTIVMWIVLKIIERRGKKP